MKKNITILTALLFMYSWFGKISAQNTRIEKLDSLIEVAQTDTGRINLILKKLDVLGTINLDSSINLALETLGEVKKSNFYRAEVDLRKKLVHNYSYKGNFKAATEQLKYLQKFIELSKDSADFAGVYASWGLLFGMQSKYDSSIIFYNKAINIYKQLKMRNHLRINYSNIAIGYQQKSNFPMALYYQQKALKISEEDKDEFGQAYTLVNMANTYSNMGNFLRAENAFLKSIKLAKKMQLNNVVLYAYSNLSTLYSNNKQWEKSYEFGLKANELGRKMGDQGIQAASLSKASRAMTAMNNYEKALSLSRHAIELADSSAQPLIISQAYSSMGFVLRAQKRWKEAIPFYEKRFEALKDTDIFTPQNGISFKELSECYEKTGRYSKALKLYKKSVVIVDSIRSKENIRKATELSMNYEFDKKEQLTKTRQDAKDQITYARQMALTTGLGLSLLLIIGAFVGYVNKKKANALLLEQKEEIENTLTKLKNTQSQLIHAEKMASLGELTAGIAHEIKNPLNFVNNFSEVSNELIEEILEEAEKGNTSEIKSIAEDLSKNLDKIIHHGKRADSIVKGMLLHSRGTSGEKTLTNINDLLEQNVSLAYHGLRALDKEFNITIEKDYDKTLDKIKVIPQDISRVLLNIINNACYAAYDKKKKSAVDFKPVLKVSTKNFNDKVEIHIKDNGNGIPGDIGDKIFQPFFTTKPTGDGTGLGLSLSYDIITKVHKGELNFKTVEGKFTEFIITLPKK